MLVSERVRLEGLLPSESDEKQALEAALAIEKYADEAKGREVTIRLGAGEDSSKPAVPLPSPAVGALVEALTQIADGNGVLVVPILPEISTQQAAELLDVSRPHLIRMLDRDELPYRRVGSHRRIRLGDVLAFREGARERKEAQRKEALHELSRAYGTDG